MLTSLEMRWFHRGAIPVQIQDWFGADTLGGTLETAEEREDFYLQIPEYDYLGIKVRQERLEIKLRKAELGVLRFGENEGNAERWIKWICEDSSAENMFPGNLLHRKPWMTVKKVRSQRCYSGCNVELTQLNFRGNIWWTLGFEAFCEEASLMDNLQTIANLVLQNYPGSELRSQDSYAYPKWLSLAL